MSKIKYFKSENGCVFQKIQGNKIIEVKNYPFLKKISKADKTMIEIESFCEIEEKEFREAYTKVLKLLIQ